MSGLFEWLQMPFVPDVQKPIKDEHAAHPVANQWRPAFMGIIAAFAGNDYGLSRGVSSVSPLRQPVVDQIRKYVADYGETLVVPPDETWSTSMAQWMGTHWEVLVDLWTAESGRSDLVLSARVFELDAGFRIEVDSVYVP